MFPFDVLKRLLDSGLSLPWMNRERAEEIVADYRDAGEAKVGELQAEVDDLLERARESRERLVEQIRSEVTRQLGAMGVATKAELAELEARLGAPATEAGATGPAAKKAVAKKAVAKRAPAKKAVAKKAPAKKAAARKAPAKRAPAKKAPARKAAPAPTAAPAGAPSPQA